MSNLQVATLVGGAGVITLSEQHLAWGITPAFKGPLPEFPFFLATLRLCLALFSANAHALGSVILSTVTDAHSGGCLLNDATCHEPACESGHRGGTYAHLQSTFRSTDRPSFPTNLLSQRPHSAQGRAARLPCSSAWTSSWVPSSLWCPRSHRAPWLLGSIAGLPTASTPGQVTFSPAQFRVVLCGL